MDRFYSEMSQADMLEIFEALDVGIFITNQEGRIVAVNEYFTRVTTMDREEIWGQNVQYLVDKGYIKESICKRIIQDKKPITWIINYKGKLEDDVIVTGKPVMNDYGELRWVVCTLRDWNILTEVHKELQTLKNQSEEYRYRLQELNIQHLEDSDFIANDRKTKKILQVAARIAALDSTVLILGNSGVGKDRLAKFIHKYSRRAGTGSFVHVNCGAIPKNLFESELFGYSAGAFTGAQRGGKPGLFEIADKGTVFLDEIAELPMFLQVKLLKVLQEKTITRVGDVREKKIDVRIIAATNRDLERLVVEGGFRQDLYYRLNVFQINISDLKERKDDIPPLVSAFTQRYNEKYLQNKIISPEVMSLFMEYDWPGNVRELEHVIERSIVLCPDEVVRTEHLPKQFNGCSFLVTEAVRLSDELSLKAIVEKIEKAVICKAIKKSDKLEDVARQLGIDLSTLTRKKQKYGLYKRDLTSLVE